MADLTITPAKVAVIESREQFTGPAAEDIVAGDYVRLDTANGKVTKGNATSAAEARRGGIAVTTAKAGLACTAIRKGKVAVGDALNALGYDADVYLSNTDGKLADAAGTTLLVVGQVFPAWGATTADKVLRVDL